MGLLVAASSRYLERSGAALVGKIDWCGQQFKDRSVGRLERPGLKTSDLSAKIQLIALDKAGKNDSFLTVVPSPFEIKKSLSGKRYGLKVRGCFALQDGTSRCPLNESVIRKLSLVVAD